MKKLTCFPPIIDSNCHILLLGSMPGVKSLEHLEYYAHPQNHFWPIMAAVCKEKLPTTYQGKTRLLLKHGLALWDVIDTCTRKGSLDGAIRDAKANNMETLIKQYPRLKVIFCNGQSSFKMYQKYHPHFDFPVDILPSSSPAYTKPLTWKTQEWMRKLKPYLRK
jgi:hypoxanthine-DNA glycosylase